MVYIKIREGKIAGEPKRGGQKTPCHMYKIQQERKRK